ncbi:MAG: hypothetical protein JWL76_1365 [Thermoleophilia bacterium]|nr:hypothetical protein [Thermoleophilia bacterium]
MLACVALATGVAGGAASNMIVNVEIPSATTLITNACLPNTSGVTDFGIVTPGSTVKTSNDCDVTFGSDNDTASLRMTQSDGIGDAMGHPTDTFTRFTGSSSRYSVLRASGTYVWALRSTGGLLRSADSGATWPISLSGLNVGGGNHSSLSLPLANAGWMTGDGTGKVYRSINANHATTPTWNVTAANPGFITDGVAGVDTLEAWVVGDNGEIGHTVNGGGAWNTSYTWPDDAGGPTAGWTNLNGIESLDADSFVAWGDGGRVITTTDGVTWNDASGNNTVAFKDVEVISDSFLVGVSSSGSIWSTTNATAAIPTWTNRSVDMMMDLLDVEFSDPLNGMAVGAEGVLVRTSDGGLTWTQEHVDSSNPMHGLVQVNATTWVADGAGLNVLQSVDSGATWNYVVTGAKTWWDVNMSTQAVGWRVGTDGSIEKTTTGGTAWTSQTSNTPADLFGVQALSEQRAVAVGRDGAVVTTSDGGATWTPRTSGVTIELRAVNALGGNAIWAVGDGGTIIQSSDFGASWRVRRQVANIDLRDVIVMTPSIVIAVGNNGVMYRTTDGGASWTTVALPTGTSDIDAIAGLPTNGIATYASASFAVRSTDNGATWATMGAIGATFATLDQPTPSVLVGSAQGTAPRKSIDGGVTWTTMAGASNYTSHWTNAIDMLDRGTGVGVGDGNLGGTTGLTGTVANYVQNTSDWIGDGTEAFGVCLRATTATPNWATNATCDQSADGAHWRGVPTIADNTTEVASTGIGDGNRVASFRFGLRIAPSEPPGELSAGITFLVISPDV